MPMTTRCNPGLWAAAVDSLLAGNSMAEEAGTVTLSYASASGERQHCRANTASGILLSRFTGADACLLGRAWGYRSARPQSSSTGS
jgi:hypothetical protein